MIRLEAIMLKYFPISARSKEIIGLIVSILIYVVVEAVLGFAFSILGKLPLIGWLIGILGSLVGLYCFIGIIVSILVFLKLVK